MSFKLTRRQFLTTSLVTTSSVFLAACGAPPAAAPPSEPSAEEASQPAAELTEDQIPRGGTIRIKGTTGKLKYYSPLWFIGSVGWDNSMPHIWPPLVMFDGNGEPAPYLAERYEYSSDSKTLTFYLPKEAQWSDGQPLTAEDVKFTWETLLKYMPQIGSSWAFIQAEQLEGGQAFADGTADEVSGIEVIDPQTVAFHLTTPDVTFVRYMWRSIAPKHMYEGATTWEDIENAEFTRNPTVHSGPFKLVNYVEAQYIEMEAVRPYWLNTPNLHEAKYIDKVIMHQIGDSNVAMTMMETNELDVYLLAGTEQALRAAESPNMTVHHKYGYGRVFWPLNMHREHMKDKRVRQAMMHALDREGLNQLSYGGTAEITISPINVPDWALNPNINPYEYSVDKAKALLAEAGWDPNQEVVFLSFAEGEDRTAAWMQQCFGDVGINLQIRHEAYTALNDVLAGGDFDIWSQGGGFIDAHPSSSAAQFSCDAWYSQVGDYCNPELDELIPQSRGALEQSEAQKIAWRMGEILQDELPALWGLQTPVTTIVSNRVGNFIPGPVVDAGGTWQLTDYYVMPAA